MERTARSGNIKTGSFRKNLAPYTGLGGQRQGFTASGKRKLQNPMQDAGN